MRKYKVVPGERVVEANAYDIHEGALIFIDNYDELVILFAPGAWRTVEAIEEEPEPSGPPNMGTVQLDFHAGPV